MEKDDFINYRRLAFEVRQLREHLRALEDSIYAPSGQKYSHTPRATSGRRHTMDSVIASHAALEEMYLQKLAEKNARLLAIELAIDSLEHPAERLVMRYRYISGYGWRRIVNLMIPKGYSERQVYRLHGYALEKLKNA